MNHYTECYLQHSLQEKIIKCCGCLHIQIFLLLRPLIDGAPKVAHISTANKDSVKLFENHLLYTEESYKISDL